MSCPDEDTLRMWECQYEWLNSQIVESLLQLVQGGEMIGHTGRRLLRSHRVRVDGSLFDQPGRGRLTLTIPTSMSASRYPGEALERALPQFDGLAQQLRQLRDRDESALDGPNESARLGPRRDQLVVRRLTGAERRRVLPQLITTALASAAETSCVAAGSYYWWQLGLRSAALEQYVSFAKLTRPAHAPILFRLVTAFTHTPHQPL